MTKISFIISIHFFRLNKTADYCVYIYTYTQHVTKCVEKRPKKGWFNNRLGADHLFAWKMKKFIGNGWMLNQSPPCISSDNKWIDLFFWNKNSYRYCGFLRRNLQPSYTFVKAIAGTVNRSTMFSLRFFHILLIATIEPCLGANERTLAGELNIFFFDCVHRVSDIHIRSEYNM